jgi:hypothetical protein
MAASCAPAGERASPEPRPMPPVKLTDDELDAVLAAARPIAVERRDGFLQAVAAALDGRELGPGLIQRIIAETQRAFFDPPDLGHVPGVKSKYR